MKLNCIIVDDEPVARKIIKEYIEDIPALKLTGEAENASEAATLLRDNFIDLLFLDIEMPKLNGISLLKTMKQQPLVIITTAYSNFAVDGFDMGVVDYLLKPIAAERFLKAVNKAIDVFELSKKTGPKDEYFYFKSDGLIEKLYFDELYYIESVSNYVMFYTQKEKKIAYLTLKGLEEQLPESFIRVHKSFIVSSGKVVKLEGDQLHLENGKIVPISSHYREKMMNYIKERLLKR